MARSFYQKRIDSVFKITTIRYNHGRITLAFRSSVEVGPKRRKRWISRIAQRNFLKIFASCSGTGLQPRRWRCCNGRPCSRRMIVLTAGAIFFSIPFIHPKEGQIGPVTFSSHEGGFALYRWHFINMSKFAWRNNGGVYQLQSAKIVMVTLAKLSEIYREQVREWLRQEIIQHRPPPDPTEIRSQLDWALVEF